MKMSEKLRQWIRQYGIWNVVARGFYEKSPLQKVSSEHRIRVCNWQSHCKRELKKYLVFPESKTSSGVSEHPNTIWWLWLQGAEQAPEIVRKCLESVEYYAEQIGYQVIKLDKEKLFDYVKLPDSIVSKWRSGKMVNAHFSDLCRLDLICRYGGFWIDSTVYLTSEINPYILDADMFLFQSSFLDTSETKISNWFLYSRQPGNSFFTAIRDTLLNWWNRHDTVNDYFIFHLVAALVMESHKYDSLIEQMPYYNNSYPTLLQKELQKKFDQEKWNFILSQSSIHKLTYKITNQDETTVFHHILNNKLGD